MPALGFWFIVFIPAIAGMIYGPLVAWLAPEARGHGVPEVMFAVAERGGHIPARIPVVKSLASALCIGGGGSVGREGPIVQIGAALGSAVAQALRLNTSRMRLLVACGASAGISATFNAPLAGPFFAMELILRDFAAESFGAVVLASVTASVVGRSVLGDNPFLTLPSFTPHSGVEYLLFAGAGALLGVVGVTFSKLLYLVEDVCDWVWRGPEWLRPAVGGLLLGGVLWLLPQLYGVGYPVLEKAMNGDYALGLLIALMVGKMVATSLTIGIGGSGGVFAPTLFIGAVGGTALGTMIHAMLPTMAGSPGAYGLIGMAAALAGATKAPITAVVILFELTGEYSIILPLMVAVAIAAGVGQLLSKDSIYTRKLTRRGVDLAGVSREWAPSAQVATISSPPPPALPETASLTAAAEALQRTVVGAVPVVNGSGVYRGILSAQVVADALTREHHTGTVLDLVRIPPTLTADTRLSQAMAVLDAAPAAGVPVVSADGTRLVGWLTHKDVLNASPPKAHT
ncbi:transport integral membrane protein [Gordonia neofelifaecis NRRL B-59395]|uniref:Transport integral membrane protein n=2 Tax=Gordonia TaxID=2053 RepID=F1YPX4_9ACTN|nr:transport integral membrane protein [Gordonia neofelifaecis NRRL B-59395]